MARISLKNPPSLSSPHESIGRGWVVCVDLSDPAIPRVLLTLLYIISDNTVSKDADAFKNISASLSAVSSTLTMPMALAQLATTVPQLGPVIADEDAFILVG